MASGLVFDDEGRDVTMDRLTEAVDDERVPVGRYPRMTPEHALRAGQVLGLAVAHGLDVVPVVDVEGNYTPAIRVRSDRLPPGVTLTLVVEAPPVALNPDCRDGKHAPCAGDAWDVERDEPTVCGCSCHVGASA